MAVSDGTPATLIVVDSSDPTSPIAPPIAVSGIGAGEEIVGIDYRPANGVLYAVTKGAGDLGRLYSVVPTTAEASQVGTGTFVLDAATEYGVDWNPVVDRLRIVSSLGLNLRVAAEPPGIVAVDSPLDYDAGDPNDAVVPQVAAVAYQNNSSGAQATTLYAFDMQEILATLGSPNGAPVSPNFGRLFTVRTTASTTNDDQGLDITPSGDAFGAFTNVVNTFLIDVDLTSGVGGLGDTLGQIGNDANLYPHISVVPAGIFSVDDAVVREAAGGLNITLHRRGGSVGNVAVDFTTLDGTATAGQDYTTTNGTFAYANGQEEDSIFIPVTQDSLVEGDETIQFALSNATNGAVAGGGAVLTIDDDDSNLSVSDVTVREDAGTALATVTRTDSVTGTVSVDAATAAGSATGADFTPANATLTFDPGVRQRQLAIPIADDELVEGTESLTVALSGVSGQGQIDDGTGSISIIDEDAADAKPVPQVEITVPTKRVAPPERPLKVGAEASGGVGGIRSVAFELDGRQLCVDDSVPFNCKAKLGVADLGSGILSATATDGEGNTGTTSASLLVRRFKPAGLELNASPGGQSEVEVEGRVALPAGVKANPGCENGSVRVHFRKGANKIAGRTVEIEGDCTFAFSESLGGSASGEIRVVGRFKGSRQLRQAAAVTRVNLG